jgi:predicted ATP-grasp superfamily ATP-dependent carboligase
VKTTGESVPATVLLAEEVWGSTLHAARSLHSAGSSVYVAVAGCGAHVYRRSRYCCAAFDLSSDRPDEICTELVDWMASRVGERPVIVFPLSDRLVEALHSSRAAYPDNFVLAVPAVAATGPLLDKSSSLRLAERAGLTVPQWITISESAHLERLSRFGGKVVLRPTMWSTAGEQYFKVSVHPDAVAAKEAACADLDGGAELIAQAYVDAPEDHVEFGILWRSQDGEVTVVCTGRKRRQSAREGGVMVWGVTECLGDVVEAASAFLDTSGFTGLGGIEFIRSGSELNFIEFNPRLEAIHFIARKAGIDTLQMALRDLGRLGPQPAPATQHAAAAWVGSAWLNRLSSDPGYRTAAAVDRYHFARSPNRVKAVWTLRDPMPGMVVGARLARRGGQRLGRRFVR